MEVILAILLLCLLVLLVAVLVQVQETTCAIGREMID